MIATPSSSAPMRWAKRLRASSLSLKKSPGEMRQGCDLRATATSPAARTVRASGDMYAQLRYATSSGISKSVRWQGIVTLTLASFAFDSAPCTCAEHSRSIPQRLARLQQRLHPVLRLRHAAEAHERLALQVENPLLR